MSPISKPAWIRHRKSPPVNSTATGTASITNYNLASRTFDISITIDGINPADVTGFHIHRVEFGVNGGVIVNIQPLAPLVAAGSGFTFNATGVSLGTALQNEATLFGGATYVNVHTAAFPGGVIRGQLFSSGNVNLATGTATGTGGISNIENATGGSAADGLTGSFAANTLSGNAGNDFLVGGPGADTMNGGANNDVLVWSNGDGSDIMNGDADTDTVQVNGNITANDVFTIGANGTRVDFDRVNPGPFSLEIGTVERLNPLGIGGDENMTVNSLAGVAGPLTINMAGLAGNDTFNVTPDVNIPINVNGFAPPVTTLPGDTLIYNGVGTKALGPDGNGPITGTGVQPVSFVSIETVQASVGNLLHDTINLSTLAPVDVAILVDGGSNGQPSTDEDRITVSGVDGIAETSVFTPTSADDGTLAITGFSLLGLTNVESVVLDGESDDETLRVSAAGRFVHTPGVAIDAGSVAVGSLLPIAYRQLGSGGQVRLAGTSGADSLVAFGFESNDTFDVVATTGEVSLQSARGLHVPLVPEAIHPIESLVLTSLGGDDAFNIAAPQPYVNGIRLDGGSPSNTDVATLTGNGTAVVVNLGTTPASTTDAAVTGGGFAGTITLSGVEIANVVAGAGSITINGTGGPDSFSVTPTSASGASIQRGSSAPVIITNNAGQLLLAEGTAGDGDTVTVHGTSGQDAINVVRGATTLSL